MELSKKDILLTIVQGDYEWADGRDGWSPSSDLDVCDWDGIICNSNAEDLDVIEGIDLDASGLFGTIPTELGLLTTLQRISMKQNSLKGTIPTLFANLPHLHHLDLMENSLSGSLPIFASPFLRNISLNDNLFSGTIPHDIGDHMPKAEHFHISNNKINGTIPSSFSNMAQLKTLILSGNELSGTIPSYLGRLKHLEYLFLNDNELIGEIPSKLGESEAPLKEIFLHNNLLSGTVPATLAELEELEKLIIESNKLTGTIPIQLCRRRLNAFFFRDSHNVTRNYCNAIACPVGYYSVDGYYPCKECVNKHSNVYLGQVGRCIRHSDLKILKTINDEWSIDAWSELEQYRNDDENYPWCSIEGITCKDDKVVALNVSGLGIAGTVPEQLGDFEFLRLLDLSDNQLTGILPSDLRFPPLTKLDVSGNQLKGSVPTMLCNKNDINGNGRDGDYNCARISCPVGTFSPTGWEEASPDGKCLPCDDALFLGTKFCASVSQEPSGGTFQLGVIGVMLSLTVVVILSVIGISHFFKTGNYVPSDLDDTDELYEINEKKNENEII